MRRSHHRFCSDDRRAVSDHSPWTALAVFLAHSISQRKTDLAKLPVAAGMGLLRHIDIPDRQQFVSASTDHSGFRAHARSYDGLAKTGLRRARHGLAGNDKAMAPAGIGDADHGNRDR